MRLAAPALALLVVIAAGAPLCAQERGRPDTGRLRPGVAVGPAIEVAMPGNRAGERGVIVAPSLGVRVTSWFEYVVEGHVMRSLGPVGGTIAALQPLGWRLHTPGGTHPFVSMGAGLTYTDFTGLHGIDRRRNYVTHVGFGVRRFTRGGSAFWVETRLSHLSNLGTAGSNMGMEHVAVMAGFSR